MGETYESAGVSIEAGEAAVERIKADVRSTFRPEVIGDIGGFGGLFRFQPEGYREPVLVSSTAGVGTQSRLSDIPSQGRVLDKRRASLAVHGTATGRDGAR